MDNKDDHTSRLETLKQFIRFNLVGLLNTALTYGIYSGLVYLGLHHIAALVIEYASGIGFSFLMNKRFTFAVRGRADSRMFARMLVAYVPMLLLNALLLWMLIDRLGWNKYAGQAVALGLVSVLSFAAQKIYVFRRRKAVAHGQ
jgi:putative flippase GtrA